VIKTDHISLKHLLEQRLHHTLQHKGLYKFLRLHYVIQYKKRTENRAIDALSRREHELSEREVLVVIKIILQWMEDLKENYKQDQLPQEVLTINSQGNSLLEGVMIHCEIIRKKQRIYVDSTSKWQVQMI
jgi:hypothetical protein